MLPGFLFVCHYFVLKYTLVRVMICDYNILPFFDTFADIKALCKIYLRLGL